MMLERAGRSNALALRAVRFDVPVRGLPHSLDGVTMCFMSDLHLDSLGPLSEILADMLASLRFDLVILGGDYRYHDHGGVALSERKLERVLAGLVGRAPVYATLGNHDVYETGRFLEHHGAIVLVNDTAVYRRGGGGLAIVGLDDQHMYEAADIEAAEAEMPAGLPKIAVSHTPELYRTLARRGYALCLFGHTHGGQICLPGGFPLMTAARVPRRIARGRWRYGSLEGYTSTGVGTSGCPARFFCRPEVALITLRQSAEASS